MRLPLPAGHPPAQRDFTRSLHQQYESLVRWSFNGDWLSWDSDLPLGAPAHSDAPFGFKPFCFETARQLGYTSVLWIDSSIIALSALNSLFDYIESRGFLFFEEDHSIGEYCHDEAVVTLGLNRETSFRLRSCWACAIGLDFTHARAGTFLNEWSLLALDGRSFPGPKWIGSHGFPRPAASDPRVKGHRYDQTAASALAYRLDLLPWWTKQDFARHLYNDRRTTYAGQSSTRDDNERTVCQPPQSVPSLVGNAAHSLEIIIFSWPGQKDAALALQSSLSAIAPTRVLHSGQDRQSDWHVLPDDTYFAAQWNWLLSHAAADFVLHVQADARCNNWHALVERARTVTAHTAVGIYEPHIDYCEIQYDLTLLRPISPGVFEIPVTDCTCWMIRRDIYQAFSPIDTSINRLGWGVPAVAAALAGERNLSVVRDYSTSVLHPPGRGYSTNEARMQRVAYFNALPTRIRESAERRIDEMRKRHVFVAPR
jgi:hypothetical protein